VRRPYLKYFGLGLIGGVALMLLLVLVLTRTEFGVERVRRLALRQIEDRIQGELRVGRITTRGLGGGAVLHDVSITDADGRPFLAADSVRLGYSWRALIRGRLVFSSAWLYRPDLTLERLPGQDEWNYQRVFKDPDPGPLVDEREARLVHFRDVRVARGTLAIRTPWEPHGPVEPADTARLILEPAPGGLVRVVRFEGVHGRFPEVRVQSPDEDGLMVRVAALAMVGHIWKEPFDLRDLRGIVTMRDSIAAFDAPRVRFPESLARALGTVVFGEDRMRVDVRLESERIALRDLNWLYPRLPDEGGGSLTLRIQTQPVGTLWLASDARVRAPGTELAGTFGIVTGDTLYFTQVDLRASPLNVELLEEIIGGRLPVDGLLVGTVEVSGPLSSLTGRGDLRLARDARSPAGASVRWSGTMDVTGGTGTRALVADVRTLDLDLLARWIPSLAGGGRVSGRVRADGEGGGLRLAGRLEHAVAGGEPSRVEGQVHLRMGESVSLAEARLHAEPLRLEELARRVPRLAHLAGDVTGPVLIRTDRGGVLVRAELDTPSGEVAFDGHYDARGGGSYSAAGRLAGFRVSDYVPDMASADVTGRFELRGHGLEAATAAVTARLDLEGSRIGDVHVSRGLLAAVLEGGVLRVDSLLALSAGGSLRGDGSIALAGEHARTLRLRAEGERLHGLLTLLPLPPGDPAGDPPWLRRLDGEVSLEATFAGVPGNWRAEGQARLADVTLDSMRLRKATADFRVHGIGGDSVAAEVTARGGGFEAGEVQVRDLALRLELRDRAGAFSAQLDGDDRRELRLAGGFHRDEDRVEVLVRELGVRSGEGVWSLAEATAVRIGEGGLGVDRLRLERDGGGAIDLRGRLSWNPDFRADDALTHEPVRFSAAFDRVPLAEMLRLGMREPRLDGRLTGSFDITGTTAEPRLAGTLGVDVFRFDDLELDHVAAAVDYGGKLVQGTAELYRRDERVLTAEARVPFDLAMGPVADRHLELPVHLAFHAGSLPAALPAVLVDGLRDVQGEVRGSVIVGGTTRAPALDGSLTLRRGAVTLAANDVRYRDIEGTFRLVGDRNVAVDASLRSGSARSRVTGAVTFGELADPDFDLTLNAVDLQVSRRRDVELTTTGEVRLTGRYTRPVLSGGARVDRGARNLDELVRQVKVVELDTPLLFDVVDTSQVSVRKFLGASSSPFVQNLAINVYLLIGRDFWLRSREMTVELSGDVGVEFDSREQDLRLTGSLSAVRGIYQLYGRRFVVREGTVDFFGAPGIDPVLNITALYRVRLPDAAPLDISAHLSGTLQAPRVALSSDAELAISQSDLASYLLFGRPTYDLAPAESRALQLASHGWRLGTELIAPTVFGYAATELEHIASGFGIDYVAITSAEVRGDQAAGELQNGAVGNLLAATRGFFAGTKVEVGRYWSENVFIAMSQRMAVGTTPGLRLEWRFHPTWTGELFWEDRFARSPGLHLAETLDTRVGGFFLFRDWSY
jgi:hypothetical protein